MKCIKNHIERKYRNTYELNSLKILDYKVQEQISNKPQGLVLIVTVLSVFAMLMSGFFSLQLSSTDEDMQVLNASIAITRDMKSYKNSSDDQKSKMILDIQNTANELRHPGKSKVPVSETFESIFLIGAVVILMLGGVSLFYLSEIRKAKLEVLYSIIDQKQRSTSLIVDNE